MKSLQILKAKVWHRRDKPAHNEFTYRVFYVSHDLREERATTPKFFSFERFNLMSLYAKDHGRRDGSNVLEWVTKSFAETGAELSDDDSIEMIAHPRVFGYVFNPITFYLVIDSKKLLKAVLCEVHNTFSDDHSYAVSHEDRRPIESDDVFSAPKGLYVSPFNLMEGGYTFSFSKTEESFKAEIVYLKDEEVVIKTAVAGMFVPCTSRKIIMTYLTHPLMTVMVIFRIHWQAVKLFFKRVPHTLKDKPVATSGGVTRATFQGKVTVKIPT